MFETFDQVRYYLAEHHIQMVDLKFSDLWGRWHHLTDSSGASLPRRSMEAGIGFDGSAVGLKSVKAGDMVLVPDLTTGVTIRSGMRAPSVLSALRWKPTRTRFSPTIRAISPSGLKNICANSGIADESRWGPEFEFYVFDDVAYENGVNRASYRLNSQEADWNSADGGHGHYIPLHGGYHAIPPKDQPLQPARRNVAQSAAMGVPVKYHHHEVGGPGQSEIETPMMGLMHGGRRHHDGQICHQDDGA